ncbi:MAG: VOC family protein [Bryobacterales bacterium]|nr:VOC family protein [Bryobacterales bacterium]
MKDINTYLMFDGNCLTAMTFYQECFGAELFKMTYGEMPGEIPKEMQAAQDRIMHASLTKGKLLLMASDTPPGQPSKTGDNFSISITCESVEEIDRLFAAIGEKGTVKMPLQETFWATRFGMLTDQFGINWMLNLERPEQK